MKNNFQQWSTKSITAKLTCLKVINVSCCFFHPVGSRIFIRHLQIRLCYLSYIIIKSGTLNQIKAVPFYNSNFFILIYIFTMTSIPDSNDRYAGKREEQKEIRHDRRRQTKSVRKYDQRNGGSGAGTGTVVRVIGWSSAFVQSSNQDRIILFGVSFVLFLEYRVININIYFTRHFNRKLPCYDVTGNILKLHN